jgi:hypothetical protein
MSLDSKESKADQLKRMLNRYASNHTMLKRGTFEVTAEEGRLVILWSYDERTERFLVKEPVTPNEMQGTVTDVVYRLKQRLTSSTAMSVAPSATPTTKN